MVQKRKFVFLIILAFLTSLSCNKYQILKTTQSQQPPQKQAAEEIFDLTQVYSQITTHPEIDIYPAISPDAQWIAFSSKRSGNMDIWIKSVRGGSASQITTHKTDDIMPTWSPDGKKITFVSYRDDALGDIWELSIKKKKNGFAAQGDPVRLTNYLGIDISPTYSPDGKYIAFTSARAGNQNIFLFHRKSKQTYQLTNDNAIQPTWSPDSRRIAYVSFSKQLNCPGQLFYANISFAKKQPEIISVVPVTSGKTNVAFPNWHPLKEEIFITRYDNDTNHDGRLDPLDQPSLWIIRFTKNEVSPETVQNGDLPTAVIQIDQENNQLSFQEMKLIQSLEYDYFPVCSRDSTVFFVSRRSGNEDIFAVNANGPIPKKSNAFFQYEFANGYFPLESNELVYNANENDLNQDELQFRLLAFNRVLDFFPEEHVLAGWALYEISKTYAAQGNINLAQAFYQDILSQFRDFTKIIQQTKLRLFELGFRINSAEIENQIKNLQVIINDSKDIPELQAEAQLFIAEVYFLNKHYTEALNELEKIIKNDVNDHQTAAIAQLLIGDIYSNFGQTDEVINAYLKIIDNYADQGFWINKALEKILLLQPQNDLYDEISGYRQLISQYGNNRRLAARAQLKIGEQFYEQKDYDAAIEELSSVLQKYSDQKEETAQAQLLLAEVSIKKNDDLRAIKYYNDVIQNFGDVQSGLYVVKAKEQLLDTYLDVGNKLRNAGEINAAYLRYRAAVQLSPKNIDANRKLISMLYAMGRIDEAVKLYTDLQTKYSSDEFFTYMVGLSYSYKSTEKSERTKDLSHFDLKTMQKSNEIIEGALSKNYRIIEAYLTLSYNYEFIEKYQTIERQKQRGWIASFLSTVVKPVESVLKWATFQKDQKPQQWYERAIDALTTAISLNSEEDNPLLESELALNLANNYYNLKEFGFERANYYYHIKLKYDPTFTSKKAEADVFKRMGHCALVVENFKDGADYLQRAIKIYQELGDEENILLNIKRLALLYQSQGEFDKSIEYFKIAAGKDEENKKYNQLEIDYRSIAYNFLMLNDTEEAIRYGEKALNLIKSERVERIKAKPNWIKIGVLGVEFPVWNLGQIGAGQSTAAGGFTTEEEEALIYAILGQSALGDRSIEKAITFLKKRLAIYRKRKDKIAEAVFLNNIAYLYFFDFKFENAWKYFESSMQICKKEDNFSGMLINLINLGSLGVLINKAGNQPEIFLFDNFDQQKRETYHKKSIEYLNFATTLWKENTVGFVGEKIQIYNLLGSLYFLEEIPLPDSLKKDQFFSIKQNYDQIKNWVKADSCYQIAYELSKLNENASEQLVILNNIANVSYGLGDIEDAFAKFNAARKLALKQDYFSWLWKIDFSLGNILFQRADKISKKSGNSAEKYLTEAIETLEQSSYQLSVFRPMPFYFSQMRALFETAVMNSISLGNIQTPLRLSEQYRGRKYLDLLGSHKIQLKKERHKIFLGNARFLKNVIYDLAKKIRRANEQSKTNAHDIGLWVKQKKNYEKEYADLLKEVKSEDPELESFIHSEPVTFRQIQEILNKNTIVLDYFLAWDRLLIWEITAESVELKQIPVNRSYVKNLKDSLFLDIENNQVPSNSESELWKILIEPVFEKISDYENIVVIPDDWFDKIPFGYLINFSHFNQTELKNVVSSPGLSSYFYCFQRRKIKGYKLAMSVIPDSAISDLDYDITTIFSKNAGINFDEDQFKMILQTNDLVYLNFNLNQNIQDPLLSLFQLTDIPILKPVKLRDFYSYDIFSSVIILNNFNNYLANDTRQILKRALLYAGCPSLVLSVNAADSAAVLFYEYFFDYLYDHAVAEAVARTQQKMRNEGYAPKHYALYQAIGFEGMNDEQERIFAKERFVSKVAMGNKYYDDKKWEDAIVAYEQALVMAKKQGDVNSINNLVELILYCAANGKFWEKAIEYQISVVQKARAENDVQKLIAEYRYLIYFYTQNKNFDQALSYQTEYLKLTEKYNLTDKTASSYQRIGLVYEQSGDYEKAVENLNHAILEYRKLGDSLNVVECLKDRGRIFSLNLDNYSTAIANQKEALRIFRIYGDDQKSMELLQNLGLSHERLANYQTALDFQLQALEMAIKLNSNQWIALSKQHLANVNWKMGNYQQALKYQQEALIIFEELKNVKFQSVGLATHGLILMSLGQIDEALVMEKKALSLAEQIQDFQDMATIHKNINLMYRQQNLWSEALEQILIAIELDKKIGSDRGLSYDYRDLGIITAQQGKNAVALNYLRSALKISQQIYDGRNLTHCLYEIGKIHFLQNNFEAAIDTLSMAAANAKKLFVPEVEWRAFRMMGHLYQKTGEMQKSLASINSALETIEKMRSKIKIEEFKSGFIDDKLDVYFDLVNLYIALNEPQKALEIVERSKSRNFIDLLANKDIHFSGNFDKQNFEQGKKLQEKMNRVQNDISILQIKENQLSAVEQQKLQNLIQQLNQLKNETENYLLNLKEQSPELASMVIVEPQSIDSFQSVLPDSVVLLEFFYTKQKLFVWRVTNKNVIVREKEMADDLLFNIVDSLRKNMQRQMPVSNISRKLYDLLIKPVEADISNSKHLIIVPHGILHYLPFAALLDEKGQYLIEGYPLSLAPSAFVLKICMEKGEMFVKHKNWQPKILAFGNPDLGNPKFDLPFADKEIESLELIYSDVQSYKREKAVESIVEQKTGEANLILFSCHGEFDPINPLFSALLLTPDKKEDGRLEAYEIFNYNMNAYLVAMSACETGLAKIAVGDEVIGLSRSFIYAGTSSLLSSLWKVDDLATAVMVKRFFRYLKQGDSRAKALQKAVVFVKNNINEHPLYWSAFNLTGDFR